MNTEKIQPTVYQVWITNECISPNYITVGGIMRGALPLYNRDALEAAVEAMKRECMHAAKEWAMMHVEVDNAPHGVDDEILKYVSTYEVLENIIGG